MRYWISILLAAALPAGAQEDRTVSVEELAELAVRNNAAIRAARYRYEAAVKRPSQVSTLPEPKFTAASFGVGHPFSRISPNDFAYVGFGVSQEIPFPGKLTLVAEEARREAEVDRQMYHAMVRETAAQVKSAYYEWFGVHKAIEITGKNRDLLERFEKITRARYAVGRGIQQDVLKAQVELSVLAQRLEMLEQKRAVIEAQIRSLVQAETPLGRPADVRLSPIARSLESLLEAVETTSPRLLSAAAMAESRATAIERARRDYRPDFNFMFQWQKTGAAFPDYYMAVAEVKIPIFFWRKQRLGVEEAVSRFRAARSDALAARQEIVFQVKDQYLQARTSERLLTLYQSGLIPQSTLALESALTGYETGSVDFLTLLSGQMSVLAWELQYYEELARHAQARARLEALVDIDLTKP